MYSKIFKRPIDIVLSLFLLLLFSPIIIIVSILLLVANKGKPFFFQRRPGKNEKIFSIIKLKSMTDEKDEHGNLLSDEQRLTKIGNFVRKTSLDELIQLINVLKGEMSLIGPRPLLVEYLTLYSEEQKKRHLVRPGITGWAQVNGRNAISFQEKFNYDVYYVNNISFLFDLKILCLTIKKVFIREGISFGNSVNTEKFSGNAK
jgi:lipopolysaccharide/colanic/teichoic acid biosynthesis glycosyltransferase